MLRNQVFTDFNLELDRSLFNDALLKIYDLVINFINLESQYNLEFWKSIWLKVVTNNQSMLLILINPKYEYLEELNKLANLLNVNSFYYQFRENKRKPEKQENIFLLKGNNTIYELIDDYKFHLSPYTFCQSNNDFANLMYNQISNILKQDSNYSELFIYGRTCSPISILTHRYFNKITCSIPCQITHQNMLKDLQENKITNIKTIYQRKEDFELEDRKYILFLSPGYQGLSKNILDKVKMLTKVEKIYLLYCNPKKIYMDLKYLGLNKINNIYKIGSLIQIYEILLNKKNSLFYSSS